MSGPLGFPASDTHLATRILKFQTEIDPECGKDLFWSSPEFEGEIPDRNRIIKFNQTSQKHFAPSEFAYSTKNRRLCYQYDN